ncbi:hypothetical protein RI129_006040 [Pyrocoelia pectoralis]|uniref:DUF243 domain-containing protein n=1 Tax=Pyrocoelia pectoralis TaxID=417401 RepID=A0AAN7VA15_9COLE
MKPCLITLSLVAVAKCRPDVSHLVPSGSYLPSGPGSVDFTSNLGSGSFSNAGNGGNLGGFNQLGDQKHVYFFAGSDDDQYSRFRINVAPSSQRNTKIIFVKAPVHKGVIPEVVAPPSLSEDKTLVYVLVKKPQDGSITIPAGVGVKQAKPQVFFVKYNNKHDAAHQVNAGVQGQAVGTYVADVGSEVAFVNTLGAGIHGGQIGSDGSIIPLLIAVVHSRPEPPQIPVGSYLPISDQNVPTNSEFGTYAYDGDAGSFGGYQQNQKHVYFFSAPDQPEYSRFRIFVTPSSQKNTKIIFVKAPSHAGVIPEVIAPPSSAEDKTLVYVLVKRPDEGGSITIPTSVGVTQTKPEVFFIKYNNKQDAQGQVSLGVEGQRVGVKVPDLPDENVFVNTLSAGNQASNGYGSGIESFGGNGQTDSDGILAQGGVTGSIGNHGPIGASGPY